jgi:hypothetical protein
MGQTVLVGASHLLRLAEEMGTDTVSLAYLGLRPREPMISNLTKQLEELCLDRSDIVVLDLLSNLALIGMQLSHCWVPGSCPPPFSHKKTWWVA